MRENKFRAWDVYQKKMYQWAEIGELNEGGHLSLWDLLNNLIAHIYPLEYTGLKDKNGKDICEGDIVTWRSVHNLEGGKHTDTVEWATGYWQLSPWIHELSQAECEIVGNIYENPELLKVSAP